MYAIYNGNLFFYTNFTQKITTENKEKAKPMFSRKYNGGYEKMINVKTDELLSKIYSIHFLLKKENSKKEDGYDTFYMDDERFYEWADADIKKGNVIIRYPNSPEHPIDRTTLKEQREEVNLDDFDIYCVQVATYFKDALYMETPEIRYVNVTKDELIELMLQHKYL